ncbi:MAG: peptide-methionine (S)-S-oxide reductase MsrA [Kiritimatiellae bacterium]|jgi:peptide-methionine (S)-S-oxide reductase|nr:peptide-methionine (S)-S-oxide reductase MsrA [Kiritimatiellia bacterium]
MKPRTLILVLLAAVSARQAQPGDAMTAPASTETATFAGGCFWCIEEIFRQQPGVRRVTSGYTGGHVDNPTYAQVCSGTTGHAEAIRVEFDPQAVSYRSLLDVFWKAHDPTQLNRQGADVGTQYRSAVFTHSEAQAAAARDSLEAENASGRHARKIVTEITPAPVFWPAEDYHQDYYRLNRRAPYCQAVIRPKLRKLGLDD